ncbi:SMI1/KNR4 family protein [Streptomyces sp. NPDC053048]|uniref:SMI1/KNR4 family protein n=1 Tax=Streptomyces sp. NPDC053048 TaxID=3365694 RepID=UPI0037D04614
MSGIAELRHLVPTHTGAGETVDWIRAAAVWGTRLPDDYVAFITEYGEGHISEFLYIFNPLSTKGDESLSQMLMETKTARALAAQLPGPWELHEPPSAPLIAWGVTSGPDILCWLTTDKDPDQWPVVVFGRHTASLPTIYNCGMAEFLRRVFLADFDECPMSGLDLWDLASPKFLHWREEQRLWDSGINPWTGEASPYAGMEWD